MKKVYLSKSNDADPKTVLQLKEWLEKEGYEVSEFIQGETYNPNKILSSDIIIGVGPDSAFTRNELKFIEFYISRGLGSEIRRFMEDVNEYAFIFHKFIDGEPKFYMVTNIEKTGSTEWKGKYFKISLVQEYFWNT